MNTVPAGQTVNEDTDLTFSSGTGNALSVADVDAFSASIQTTVSRAERDDHPADGRATGATITGSGTASAQITGTLTQVNAALAGLKYKGTPTGTRAVAQRR